MHPAPVQPLPTPSPAPGARAPLALGALCGLGCLAALGSPASHVADLRADLGSGAGTAVVGGDPIAVLVPTAALLAWACATWLGGVAVVLLGARLPGVVGLACHRVSGALAPAAARRLVAATLGLGVAAGLAAPTAALAADAPRPPTDAVSAAPYDWPAPALADPLTAAGTTTPAAAPDAAHPSAPAAVSGSPAPVVVVAPGDCLWHLAARDLGPSARDAQVAAAWPEWWSANRHVIGDDPDLLLPGQVLRPPR